MSPAHHNEGSRHNLGPMTATIRPFDFSQKNLKVFSVSQTDLALPVDDLERLWTVSDAAGVALWCWRLVEDELRLNRQARKLLGVVDADPVSIADVIALIMPDDLEILIPILVPADVATGEFDIRFRIFRNAEVRWLSARGNRADKTAGSGTTFAILSDVTEHERLEQRRRMFAAEMEHRVKNSFAIASALTSLVARSAASTKTMAVDLQARFAALCRAHDLVRPRGPGAGHAQLSELISALLMAYDRGSDHSTRISLTIPQMLIGEVAATTLALVFHELGTNSVKYGSLSCTEGTLDVVALHDDQDVLIVWTERGGPPASRSGTPSGFGMRLIEQSVTAQLGGSASFAWKQEGLTASLRVMKSRMSL